MPFSVSDKENECQEKRSKKTAFAPRLRVSKGEGEQVEQMTILLPGTAATGIAKE